MELAAPTYTDVLAASARVSKILAPSPLTHSAALSEIAGRDVFCKWDNKLRTGSFKERGAINFLSALGEEAKRSGVCAASLGNHAMALSVHSRRLSIPCTIVMPEFAPLVKVQSTRKAGARVILYGSTFDEANEHAIKLSAEEQLTFVPAFDHPLIIAGQGTAGIEIFQQCPDVDSLIVPVGGGGLISGVALAIKQLKPDVFVVGAQSEWAVTAQRGGHSSGKIFAPVSIADGIAVKRIGKFTGPIIERCVDKLVALDDNKIAEAVVSFVELERMVVEGGGAAGLAALVAGALPERCKKTVLLVSGSNIDMGLLYRLIERDMALRHRLLRVVVAMPDRPGALSTISHLIAEVGANIVEVSHDRTFSRSPAFVDVTFSLEVRDEEHKSALLAALRQRGLEVREITA